MTLSIMSALSFAGAMAVFAAIPGPGVLGTMARSMASGLKPARALILGVILGDCVYLLFACFGLSYIARNLGQLFLVVKLAGGLYLFWMGVKMWLERPVNGDSEAGVQDRHWGGHVMSGALISLSNPKVILFYCGFLPAFLDLSHITIMDMAVLSCIVTVVLGLVLTAYAVLARSAHRAIATPQSRRHLNRTAACMMMSAGVLVASKEI